MSTTETDAPAAGDTPLSLRDKVVRELREWGVTLAVFIPVFYVFSLIAYEQRVIPSESMVPNLRVGDRVAVAKFAYGYNRYSLPWGLGQVLPLGDGRLFASDPERGDVAVFMHPHFNRVMIKRVVGLPGDRVAFRNGRMILNGEAVDTELLRRVRYVPHDERRPRVARELQEAVDGDSWIVHQLSEGDPGDTTDEFRVPEGYLLFVGDNRDNSKDGREPSGHCPSINGVIDRAGCRLASHLNPADVSIGFVPMDHLIGRAETVILSFYRCQKIADAECLDGRVWKGL